MKDRDLEMLRLAGISVISSEELTDALMPVVILHAVDTMLHAAVQSARRMYLTITRLKDIGIEDVYDLTLFRQAGLQFLDAAESIAASLDTTTDPQDVQDAQAEAVRLMEKLRKEFKELDVSPIVKDATS